jgi:hypothetical protein
MSLARVILALLLLFSLPGWGADFTARVDHTQLIPGETFELILESSDPTLFGKPDLSPLEPQFDILGTRQINQLSTAPDQSEPVTRWIVTLQPRQRGIVVIPPLTLSGVQSQPITLHVSETSTLTPSAQNLKAVFIDASVDRETVYVQAQLILTLRILHSVPLYDDSNLSTLTLSSARVEPLGEPRTYEQTIGGVRHGVIEIRYAIFPQQSGSLRIPSLSFSATAVETAANSQQMSPFSSRPGRAIRVDTSEIPIQVKPKPTDYPSDAPWLPARQIELSEAWNPQPTEARQGAVLTRHVVLKAEGLSSAQLPPLPQPTVDGLRRYPDQARLTNEVQDQSLVGSREEREALVPGRSGDLSLPPLEITWWNTQTDQLERTQLPAHTLTVAADPALALPLQSEPSTVMGGKRPLLWPWQLACLVLLLTTVIGFGLWWQARQLPAIVKAASAGPSPRTLLDDLRRACLANNPQATRQALDAWARQQPETLAEIAARFDPLSVALDDLNGALYSESGQHWQGETLWQALQALPPPTPLTQQEPGTLPPLYPR